MYPSEGGWSAATDGTWDRNRHIFNICKYLSAVSVIVFDALQGSIRSGDHFDPSEILRPNFFQGMWICSVIVKTASSIYWDHTQVPEERSPLCSRVTHMFYAGMGAVCVGWAGATHVEVLADHGSQRRAALRVDSWYQPKCGLQ
jgi:hypothetical protein